MIANILFDNGSRVDTYLLHPEVTDEPPAYGNPEKTCTLLDIPQHAKELAEIMQNDYVFAEEGLFEFLSLLGIETDLFFEGTPEDALVIVFNALLVWKKALHYCAGLFSKQEGAFVMSTINWD